MAWVSALSKQNGGEKRENGELEAIGYLVECSHSDSVLRAGRRRGADDFTRSIVYAAGFALRLYEM